MPLPLDKRSWLKCAVAIVAGLLLAREAQAIDYAKEQREVQEWREQRLERLKSPTGWLTLVGLYWLKEGENTFGSDAANSLALDYPGVPARLGTFVLQEGKVRFIAQPTSGVQANGKSVADLELISDAAAGKPTVLNF